MNRIKTTKLVPGILAIVLCCVTALQSCVAVLADGLEDTGGTGGLAGMLFTVCMLVGGIVGIATRNSRGGGMTAGIFFLAGALIAFLLHGSYSDLMSWAFAALVFGIVFLAGSWKMPKASQNRE